MDGREGRERAELGYVREGDVAWYPSVRVPNCKRSEYSEREMRQRQCVQMASSIDGSDVS